MARNSQRARTTVNRVTNLHCTSCVSTVERCIEKLSSLPTSVEISLEQHLVTVNHSKELSPSTIRSALLEAGFDVLPGTDQLHEDIHFPNTPNEKHLEYCGHCKAQHERLLAGAEQTQSSGVEEDPQYPCAVTLSVGGMTCSSCAITITEAVSRMRGVSDVVVNVLEGFATVVVEAKGLAEDVSNSIEDCGFEARILNVEPLRQEGKERDQPSERTVSLRVDGLSSRDCARKVMSAIELFGNSITVLKPLTSHTDPILTISYRPNVPTLSIRVIMASVASAGSPPFRVTIEQPLTIEQLSRAMQLRERRSIFFRLLFAFVAAIPTLIIGVVYMTMVKDGDPTKEYLMQPIWAGNVPRAEWALLFISTPVMFYSASGYHKRTVKEISALWRPGSSVPYLERFTRFGSMNMLVSFGVSVSYFASIGLMVLAARTPHQRTGSTTTYFDTVVFLTMFLLAGRYIEAYSKARTADAVSALTSLRPADAFLLVRTKPRESLSPTASTVDDAEKGGLDLEQDGQVVPLHSSIEKVPVDHLEIGDIVRVASGSTPPADGSIISGQQGLFDESSLTGESRLIKKLRGDQVFVGTINKGQPLHVRVEAIGGTTMLDKIVKVVREGQTHRAPIERVADRIVRYFVPVVTLLSLVTWVIWLALGLNGSLPAHYLDIEIGGWPVWSLQFAIAVFVVACPCGIALAAPTALLVGMGLAAKFGILARGGGEAFQEMAQLDLMVFDKTGTLTEGGEPRVSDCVIPSSSPWPRSTILGIATELESVSTHPLATAIRHFAKDSDNQTGASFEEIAGKGVKAVFASLQCTAIIGNEVWMKDHGAVINDDLSRRLMDWKLEAKSVVLLALRRDQDDVFCIAAIFAVADPLRPGVLEVISQLADQGISSWMISGDNFTTASAVARAVGIPADHVIAGVLPHEKSQHIERLQRDSSKRNSGSGKWTRTRSQTRTIVGMVGDGINDAPALAVADVGIAIGSGSDIALSSASFILLSSDLRSLITLHDLSRRIINRVKFNFGWAMIYNMIAVPVAAGVIYPAGHRLDPVWASLAMALSSVSVVCSSLLLRTYKEPPVQRAARSVNSGRDSPKSEQIERPS
ncbi:putative heavy-metal-associated domain containing protein [Lyophyllum shimeji]|uniref:Heavy-metal-associated domain containing protein n=1 Tax=Lyophyllum shimeji TaxID=47721 RepID=A0A9P3UI08_LYOSH|nr:putative heavy-metal-associated domain containing protein [Lyophyllum shimeji]